MPSEPYRFAAEFRAPDGRVLTQRLFAPDFEPALEWAAFVARRQGRTSGDFDLRDATIQPLAHPEAGWPYLGGFEARLAGGHRVGFQNRYFLMQLRGLRRALIKEGVLPAAESARVAVLAYPAPQDAGRAEPAVFQVEEIATAPLIVPGSFATLVAGATPFGEQTPGDFPVIIAPEVLAETAELTLAAQGAETGGILIGQLWEDRSAGELGARVTAQIPARLAEGEAQKLTFTPETWVAVQAALELRRSDEIWLGWWHSHPSRANWCRDCPPARREQCPLMGSFFSVDDEHLHRAVFGRAFMVALVVTDAESGLTHDLYGYREGVIASRGYLVSRGSRPLRARSASHSQSAIESHEETCPGS